MTAMVRNCCHVYASGAWNDYRVDDSNIAGYLIEYGGMSGDPDADLTEDKSYNVATEGQFASIKAEIIAEAIA